MLITGAAVGIGRGAAIEFAQKGAKVVLVDVSQEKLESVKKELSEYTEEVLTFVCDEKRVYEVVRQACEIYGKMIFL